MSNLLVWPVALPLAGALIAMVWPRHAGLVGVTAGLATSVVSILVLLEVTRGGALVLALGGWEPGLGIALRADALAGVLLVMSALVALAASIYATGYFTKLETRRRFWPLWLMLLAALHGLLLSADLFNVYVNLELLGLSAVTLAALGGTADAVRAALRYLVVGLLGSLAFLAGVALVYARYGTLDMIALTAVLQPEPAAWVAFSLMSAGLLIKCALFPLHFWLPPAHANAPAPVSAVLSALVVKVAFYLIVRLWLELFQPALTPTTSWLLGLLGACAVLWGSLNALAAQRLKLLAAYSTVAQLGYLFLFFPLLSALAPGGAREVAFGALVLLALSHGFAKSALFLAAGVIQQRLGHDRIVDLGGTARALPVTLFALALAGTALVGLPPSGTFLAKWQLISSAFDTGQWLWVPVIGAGSLLSAAYIFRVLGHAMKPSDEVTRSPVWIGGEVSALVLALVATGVLGLGAATLWEWVAPGVFAMEVRP